MNILFLDIDGVLLPFGSYNDWYLAEATGNPQEFMEATAKRCVGIENIKKFCEDNNAQLVLISTWRYIFDEEYLWKFFWDADLTEYFHEDWIAYRPSMFRHTKASDIAVWLMKHEGIKNWWIIDDQDQGVPEGHWIKTDPYKGYVGVEDDPCE